MPSFKNEFSHEESMLEVLEGKYVLVSLPNHINFSLPRKSGLKVAIYDPAELTLVLEEQSWQEIAEKYPEARTQFGYKAIRLTQEFPLETVGVMAKLATALTKADVAIMAYSTFKTDIILVRKSELEKALSVLWDLRF